MIEVIIIGAGQAGLAASHHLGKKGIEHVVLDAAPAPASTWRSRWDTFTLVTVNFMLNLPGAEYRGAQPEGNLNREEVVQYLETYASGKPIQYNTAVTAVEGSAGGKGFRLETSQGPMTARQVILATGAFQNPKIPSFAGEIPPDILQIHSGGYRNPGLLPDGAVLVVGSGQTGCQLAEEINQAGRRVYLSVGKAGRAPRRTRGHDTLYWLTKFGFFDVTPDQLPSPQARFAANPQISGKDGGHDLNLHQFARDGITLMGHINGVSGSKLLINPDLHENLSRTDAFEKDLMTRLDQWIVKNFPDAPALEERPVLDAGFSSPEVDSLDLHSAGIRTIIWTCGYRNDYSMVHLPVFDAAGWPVQTRGVTAVPGLYFMGLPFMTRRASSLLLGVGEDAAYLSECVAVLAASKNEPAVPSG